MELNLCINFLMSRAQHSVLQIFKKELVPYKVTPAQYGVLNCLWQEDGQTPRAIAERLFIDGSTMTGILGRMEQKELIKREPDAKDRRSVRVKLTSKGREMENVLCGVIEAANEKTLAGFSPEEISIFKELLRRVYNDNKP